LDNNIFVKISFLAIKNECLIIMCIFKGILLEVIMQVAAERWVPQLA
jgi:hypothetical protein